MAKVTSPETRSARCPACIEARRSCSSFQQPASLAGELDTVCPSLCVLQASMAMLDEAVKASLASLDAAGLGLNLLPPKSSGMCLPVQS
jgi:hypothetical protein